MNHLVAQSERPQTRFLRTEQSPKALDHTPEDRLLAQI